MKFKCWIKSVWYAIIGKNWYEKTWIKMNTPTNSGS